MGTTAIVTVEGDTIISAPTNYQGFSYRATTNICTPTNKRCVRKWDTLKGVFPGLVRDRTFLDIGASFGFFCFKGLECGASAVYGIEGHKPYWDAVNDAMQELPARPSPMGWFHDRWPSEHYEADVVMAISMVHHLYGAMGNSLGAVLESFKKATYQYALVEFIRPEDKQARRKGLDKRADYTLDGFLALANGLFHRVNWVGKGHHDTRDIFLMEK